MGHSRSLSSCAAAIGVAMGTVTKRLMPGSCLKKSPLPNGSSFSLSSLRPPRRRSVAPAESPLRGLHSRPPRLAPAEPYTLALDSLASPFPTCSLSPSQLVTPRLPAERLQV